MSEGGAALGTAVVRRARRSDGTWVEALLRQAELPWEVGAQLESGFEVAEADGTVVGVAGLEVHGRDGLLRSVAVAPEWRGRGVGEALVRGRLAEAARLGLERVFLLTTTAEPWFARLGFERMERDVVPEPVRRSSEFASLCPDTAAVMVVAVGGSRGAEADAGESLKSVVREKYAAAARAAAGGGKASCCGPVVQLAPAPAAGGVDPAAIVAARAGAPVVSCCGGPSGDDALAVLATGRDPITSDLYADAETRDLPAEAVLASLGCGNPTALAQLEPGQKVLDLGSGGGIDVLLSARRVGPTGFAWGLDMTDDMLELARSNQAKAGVANVEFLKGDIEAIPLPDATVDVIISNCVINLAADKARVLREAFRVLRPGGRFAVSDVVARKDVPEPVRRNLELWIGCVAGALHERDYERLLREAGFEDVSVEPTRIYSGADAGVLLEGAGVAAADAGELDGAFMSAFVRARKPLG